MKKKLVYRSKQGVSIGQPLSDLQENNRWLKVLALSVLGILIFIIVLFLWLKFSGLGHNIIYELSPR